MQQQINEGKVFDLILEGWENACLMQQIEGMILRRVYNPISMNEKQLKLAKFIFSLEPMLNEHKNLRRHIIENAETRRIDKVFQTPIDANEISSGWSIGANIPTILADWAWNGKRIYTISPEIQGLLQSLSLDKLKLSDLEPPLSSFCLKLGTPVELKTEKGSPTYGGIGMSTFCTHIMWSGYTNLIDDKCGLADMDIIFIIQVRGVEEFENKRKFFEKAMELAKNPRKMADYEAYTKSKSAKRKLAPKYTLALNFISQSGYESECEEIINFDVNEGDIKSGELLRIFLNFVVYLSVLNNPKNRKQDYEVRKYTPPAEIRAERRIIQEHEVFEIKNTSLLDKLAKEAGIQKNLKTGGYQIGAHWRKAHRRRRPGFGNDPLAPKDVSVRFTLVKKIIVKDQGGVIGSTQKSNSVAL